jgi:RimJ/RimL family protein N-acetyltransferase
MGVSMCGTSIYNNDSSSCLDVYVETIQPSTVYSRGSPNHKMEDPVTSSNQFYLSKFNPDNPEHCEFLVTLWNTPLFISSEGKTDIDTLKKAKERIEERFLGEYERNGYGQFLVSLKPHPSASYLESPFIGTVCLNIGDSPNSHTVPDIGYVTLPEYCGKGYATEASKLLMKYAKEELGVKGIFGFCDPKNLASRRVMEKAGFEYRGTQKLTCFGGALSIVYALPDMEQDLTVYGVNKSE